MQKDLILFIKQIIGNLHLLAQDLEEVQILKLQKRLGLVYQILLKRMKLNRF